MWKQWTNVALGLLVSVLSYYGAGVGWLATCGIVITLLALWTGLGGISEESEMAHAH